MIFLGRLPIIMISNHFAISIPYVGSIGYLLYFALLDPIAAVIVTRFPINLCSFLQLQYIAD